MKEKCKYGNAYITLLSTEDYLPAVLVLKESFKKVNARYPLICAVTEDICSKDIETSLKNHDIFIERIPRLYYCPETRKKEEGETVLNTASKIALFNLKDYEKLCYIDADTMVVQNIDNVFNWLDGSMVEPSPSEEDDRYGFTGLFVFQPVYHRYDFYKKLITECEGADGDILGSLWFYTRTSLSHRIPYSYCMHYSYAEVLIRRERQGRVLPKVIHFCNKEKPWLKKYEPFFKDKKDSYISLYRELLNKI